MSGENKHTIVAVVASIETSSQPIHSFDLDMSDICCSLREASA